MQEKAIPAAHIYDGLNRFLPCFFRYINPIIHSHRTEKGPLNENQLKVLMSLDRKDGLSPAEISRIFNIPKTSLTTIIRYLVKEGYIEKKLNTADPRKFTLSLSSEGKRLVDRKHEENIRALDKLFGGMENSEKRRLIEGFAALEEYFIRMGEAI